MASRIAFQGELGAFSHIACQAWYPRHAPWPCATFAEALNAAAAGACELALVPVHNSIAGEVPGVARLLAETAVRRVAEHLLPIRMHLMALPGVTLREIATVSSHVMALRQCGAAIRRLGLRPVPALDTAGAARALRQSGDREAAVIASELAAELYGLELLQLDVQDVEENATRFVALRSVSEQAAA